MLLSKCLYSFLAAFCWALRFLRVATRDCMSKTAPALSPEFSLSARPDVDEAAMLLLLPVCFYFFLEIKPIAANLLRKLLLLLFFWLLAAAAAVVADASVVDQFRIRSVDCRVATRGSLGGPPTLLRERDACVVLM